MADRVTMARPNPGVQKANWNQARAGVQDIGAMAGVGDHWVEPARTRDDHEGDARVVEKVEPLNMVAARSTGRDAAEAGRQAYIDAAHAAGRTLPGDPEQMIAIMAGQVPTCLLCQRPESECAVLVELHSGHICDQCTEEAVDAVRQELPKRRLRLAMERMLAGEVSIETVEMIEKMSGGKNG